MARHWRRSDRRGRDMDGRPRQMNIHAAAAAATAAICRHRGRFIRHLAPARQFPGVRRQTACSTCRLNSRRDAANADSPTQQVASDTMSRRRFLCECSPALAIGNVHCMNTSLTFLTRYILTSFYFYMLIHSCIFTTKRDSKNRIETGLN